MSCACGGMSFFLLYFTKPLVGDLFLVFKSVCRESLSVFAAVGSAPEKMRTFLCLALGDGYALI